jgi:hypothetical protein
VNVRAAHRRVPTRAATLILVAFLGVTATSGPKAQAQQEIPVTLRARTFHYDRATQVLVATGEVVVIYQDVTIRTDRLRANLATNDVRAEGNVVIEVGRYLARGATLDYNLTTRQGRIEQAEADYRGRPVLGTVHVRSAVVEGIVGGPAAATDSFCTTCEGPSPVAYLTARELRVYPGDKLIGRGVTVWIGGRRILTWPYFIIFLREPRATRLLPVAGYSDVEGYYLKTFYTYALNPDQYGYLRLDLMDRLGVGYGIEHTYRFPTAGGTAFLYRLENKQTAGQDLRAVVNHRQQFGDVQTRLYTDYTTRTSPLFPSSEIFASLDASYRGPVFSTTLYQSYVDRTFTGFGFRTYVARVLHRHQMTTALSAEVVGDFSSNRSFLGTDDELFPRLTLRYRGAGYSASLVAEGRIDVDGDRFTGDVRSTTERLPELTVVSDARLLAGTRLVYQLQGGVGRFRETRPLFGMDAVRTDAGLTISGPLLESDQGYASVRALLRGFYYSTGDLRGSLAGRAEYTRFFGNAWTAQAAVTYQDQAGQTPFTFDRAFGRIAQAETTLTYRKPNLLVTGSASFDAVGGRWSPAVVRAQYAPRSDWVIAAALAYDPMQGFLSRAELSFDVKLDPRWQVLYYGYYDGFSGRVFHDRLTITRIWEECLATALTYRGTTGEIWLEAWLTALPWARGRVGVGSQGNILFDQPWLIPR